MKSLNINIPLHYLLWPWRRNPFLKWVSDRVRLDKAGFLVLALAILAFLVESGFILSNALGNVSFFRSDFTEFLLFVSFRAAAYNVFWWLLIPALVTYRASAWVRDRRFTPLLLTSLTSRELGQLLLASDVLGLTLLSILQAAGVLGLAALLDYRLTGLLITLTCLQLAINIATIHAHSWMVLTFTTDSRFFPKILWYMFCFGLVEFFWYGLFIFLVLGGADVMSSASGNQRLGEMGELWVLAILIAFGAIILLTKVTVGRVYRGKFCERVEHNPDCYPG